MVKVSAKAKASHPEAMVEPKASGSPEDASSEDDDDSSSGSEDEVDPDSVTALMDLEAAIEDNPNLYDKHVEVSAT